MRWWRGLAAALLAVACGTAAGGEVVSRVFPARGEVELAFTPGNAPEKVIVRALDEARQAIYVQAYAFTSTRIADALVHAHDRGLSVEVLADARMNQRGNRALTRLLDAGVPVAFETRYNAAHNKVMVIDPAGPQPAVVTGSYNYTYSASHTNAENLLVLRGNGPLAQAYLANWRAHREEATPVRHLPWRGQAND